MSTKVFLLSGYEVGFTTRDDSYFPEEGVRLAYFDNSSDGINKRVAYNGGSAAIWWLRSQDVSSGTNIFGVDING